MNNPRNEWRANVALAEASALRRAEAQHWQAILAPCGAPRAKRAKYRTGRTLLAALFGKGAR